jgi:tungstate transport system ATP-binding protein
VTLHAERPAAASSARNLFPARIVALASSGPLVKVRLQGAFPLSAYVTAESLATLALIEGKEVFASFKATSVHVIPRASHG